LQIPAVQQTNWMIVLTMLAIPGLSFALLAVLLNLNVGSCERPLVICPVAIVRHENVLLENFPIKYKRNNNEYELPADITLGFNKSSDLCLVGFYASPSFQEQVELQKTVPGPNYIRIKQYERRENSDESMSCKIENTIIQFVCCTAGICKPAISAVVAYPTPLSSIRIIIEEHCNVKNSLLVKNGTGTSTNEIIQWTDSPKSQQFDHREVLYVKTLSLQ